MSAFNKLQIPGGHNALKKTGGGSSEGGAPALVSDREVLGLPVEKWQGVLNACPGHLRGRGQNALDKALSADSSGDRQALAAADRELAEIVTQAVALSNDQQCAKLITASRRTIDRNQIGAWYAHLEGAGR